MVFYLLATRQNLFINDDRPPVIASVAKPSLFTEKRNLRIPFRLLPAMTDANQTSFVFWCKTVRDNNHVDQQWF
jgi:hypothetical protein